MRLLAGLHQSPRRVSALLHAPRRGWATCAGRSPGSRLRRFCQPSRRIQCGPFSGICGNSSPLTVAGAAPELRVAALTVFPFSPVCVAATRNLHNFKGPEPAVRVKRSASRVAQKPRVIGAQTTGSGGVNTTSLSLTTGPPGVSKPRTVWRMRTPFSCLKNVNRL